MTTVLLSGAAGMLGAHLLRLLVRRKDLQIRVLFPPENSDPRWRQVRDDLLHPAGNPFSSIHSLFGDVRRPHLGLSSPEWKALSTVDVVMQCTDEPAAGLHAGSGPTPLEAARAWTQVLDTHPKLSLVHVSTAFVAGRRRGLFTEFDLNCGQGFHSEWERAHFEAESFLRGSAASRRVTVFRPSLVVGDSRDGSAFVRSGFYGVLSLLRRGGPMILCGDPRARLDIVPVDYVAEAVAALASLEARGRTYHLVAGWAGSRTLRELTRMVRSPGQGATSAAILPPLLGPLVRGLRLLQAAGIKAYAPTRAVAYGGHLRQPAIFDDFVARRELSRHGISCPPVETYLARALEFAEACERGEHRRGGDPRVPPLRPPDAARAGRA